MKVRRNYIIIIILTVITLGIAVWYFTTAAQVSEQSQQTADIDSSEATPSENKFATLTGEAYDEAYIADMLAHHEGAVNMGENALGASDNDEVRELASEIVSSQSQEMMQMMNWQKEWGYDASYGGHGGHSGEANDMSGDMMNMGAELQGLSGDEFDEKFLSLMIVHHQQAVEMSEFADTNASRQEIKDFAANVIRVQEDEIARMQEWQKERGFTVTDGSEASSMPGMNH